MMRSSLSTAFGAVVLSAALLAQQPPVPQTSAPTPAPAAAVETQKAPALSDAEIEQFLLKAKVIKTKGIKKGVTGSIQATLSDGKITHLAHIQTIDERKQQFVGDKGGVEFDFRDSWTFNLAGYRIDRLLGMNVVPVSVERTHGYSSAAFTWWLDDVKMDEEERLARKKENEKGKGPPKEAEPPDVEKWNQQMQMVRVFDQLIGNVDRNLGNLVITNDWRLWPIDHTRAFRTNKPLKAADNVTRCERTVLERMKALDKATLTRETGKYLSTFQIDAVLARRDAIVKRLEGLGPSALYDRSGW
jgi:hypothetical protein